MGTQRRVEDIVVDLDAGYSVGGDDSFQADTGEHGYDNYFPVMNVSNGYSLLGCKCLLIHYPVCNDNLFPI